MSRTDHIAGDERTAEEAVRWFARLQDEAASADDWQAFERWLGASPAHADAYGRLERLWAEIDGMAPELRRALSPEPQAAQARFGRRPAQTLTRRRWIAGATAAAAGLGGVLLLRAGVDSTPPTAGGQVYEATPGQIRKMRLADGTLMRLNAGSRVAVRMDRDARRVVMADAEAVFDVAHDADRPFLIRVADREVRVVGTEFNLRRRAGKIVLTVRRGLVEVRPAGQAQAAATRLAPGEQLVHLEASGRSMVSSVDPDEAFGWTEGRLIYRDQPLAEVAADLERRFGRKIRAADARTGETRFTGVLVLDEQGAVLQRLAALAPVQVQRGDDGSVVLHRPD